MSEPDSRERGDRHFLFTALAVYTLYTRYFLRPIWRLFPDHLTPNARDPLFNLYVLKWGAHQAREGFPAFWDANFYFPVRGALALSDHLLAPALLTAAFPNPIAAYNFLLFGSFVASGLTTAYVLRAAGCGRFTAALGGAMWAFAPFRLMHLNHLQILLAQFLPLALLLWQRLLERPTAKRAALFLLVYVLHLSGGSYLAYIAHVPLLFLLAACLLLSHAAVYVPLMRVVPGLSGMRVPARFYVVVSLALAYWAARGADRLLARFKADLLARWRREHELSPRPAVRRVYEGGGDLVYAFLGRRPEDV